MTVRRTLARRLAALAAAGAAVLSLDVSPAGALPVLESGDAAELARALADATEDQDVCYGWKVEISDYGGANDGIDEGSSLGVGGPGQLQRPVQRRRGAHVRRSVRERNPAERPAG
jgi:hypothetical protein